MVSPILFQRARHPTPYRRRKDDGLPRWCRARLIVGADLRVCRFTRNPAIDRTPPCRLARIVYAALRCVTAHDCSSVDHAQEGSPSWYAHSSAVGLTVQLACPALRVAAVTTTESRYPTSSPAAGSNLSGWSPSVDRASVAGTQPVRLSSATIPKRTVTPSTRGLATTESTTARAAIHGGADYNNDESAHGDDLIDRSERRSSRTRIPGPGDLRRRELPAPYRALRKPRCSSSVPSAPHARRRRTYAPRSLRRAACRFWWSSRASV
jgi:hypothetical protein